MRLPRSQGEVVSWGWREQAVLIFWVWPKHLCTEIQPGPFAQSWDFSSAQVTSIFFFPLRTTISFNLAWLLSLLFSMKEIQRSIFVAVPFILHFGSNLGGRSFNPWVVTWTMLGQTCVRHDVLGFCFQLFLASNLMEGLEWGVTQVVSKCLLLGFWFWGGHLTSLSPVKWGD